MAGIYLHIPFCKRACHYCDFYFSTSLRHKSDLIKALIGEIELRKFYLQKEPIETIYFGGGTPSLLNAPELIQLTDAIRRNFSIAKGPEITLEANPDDLSKQYLSELKNTSINRLSIGLQSFHDEDLRWMNRAHSALEAENCVKLAQDSGFSNINIDLIYGFGLLTDEKWKVNIQKAIAVRVNHISAYSMTVEPKTVLAKKIDKGLEPYPDDAVSAKQFNLLTDQMENAGYEHYEISNFSLPGQYSKHNTNYWKSVSYLGLGPSAHSFNGSARQWNVSNNHRYVDAISSGIVPSTEEMLTKKDQQNEYVMTGLRTMWGIDLSRLNLTEELLLSIKNFKGRGWLIQDANTLKLTGLGKLYADYISSSLFV